MYSVYKYTDSDCWKIIPTRSCQTNRDLVESYDRMVFVENINCLKSVDTNWAKNKRGNKIWVYDDNNHVILQSDKPYVRK